MVVIQEFFGV